MKTRQSVLLWMLSAYLLLWILLSIAPVSRSDWFLENLLVFVTFIVLGATYLRFQFSDASYALILFFLALHAFGAHYTYAEVPAGYWLAHLFHLERNHFDRIIHFGFGLLILYPMRELLLRAARVHERWAILLAICAIFALSSFFEILEAIIAQLVHPDLGSAYLGMQGDIWDAQKDMAAALFGAIIAIAFIPRLPRVRNEAASD